MQVRNGHERHIKVLGISGRGEGCLLVEHVHDPSGLRHAHFAGGARHEHVGGVRPNVNQYNNKRGDAVKVRRLGFAQGITR